MSADEARHEPGQGGPGTFPERHEHDAEEDRHHEIESETPGLRHEGACEEAAKRRGEPHQSRGSSRIPAARRHPGRPRCDSACSTSQPASVMRKRLSAVRARGSSFSQGCSVAPSRIMRALTMAVTVMIVRIVDGRPDLLPDFEPDHLGCARIDEGGEPEGFAERQTLLGRCRAEGQGEHDEAGKGGQRGTRAIAQACRGKIRAESGGHERHALCLPASPPSIGDSIESETIVIADCRCLADGAVDQGRHLERSPRRSS